MITEAENKKRQLDFLAVQINLHAGNAAVSSLQAIAYSGLAHSAMAIQRHLPSAASRFQRKGAKAQRRKDAREKGFSGRPAAVTVL